MKPFAIAALLALQSQPAAAQAGPARAAPARAAEAAPSEALIDRFIAALPHQEEFTKAEEIDPAEFARLAALNPDKEAQVRAVLQADLACTGPAVTAGTMRVLRTVARNLGEVRLRKLIGFYQGPDYAALEALATRMETSASSSPADSAAMARIMETYPLQAFQDQMGRAEEMFMADRGFVDAALKCGFKQEEAFEAAGLKSK